MKNRPGLEILTLLLGVLCAVGTLRAQDATPPAPVESPQVAFTFRAPGELFVDRDSDGVVNLYGTDDDGGYLSILSLPDEDKLLGEVLEAFVRSRALELRQEGDRPRIGPIRQSTVGGRTYHFRWIRIESPEGSARIHGVYVFLHPEAPARPQVVLVECSFDQVTRFNEIARKVVESLELAPATGRS